tara:strand:- start:272 stop:772 length:501 start_codon:yes stop_codon:yes gene_type:complete
MKHNCYISIGSNLGDRLLNIDRSIIELSFFSKMVKSSSYYETPSWGYNDTRDYINIVVHIKTLLKPDVLLRKIKLIESKMGRKVNKQSHYSARIIDLDILFFDDFILNRNNLIVPHPKLYHRKFVLVPLCEISAQLQCPVKNITIENLLLQTKDNSRISLFKKSLN